MSKEREIKDVIQQIAGDGGRSQGLFFVADVVSASDDVCDVKVDELTLTNVRTGAIADTNANKLRIKPKLGSKVMVADLYGDKTQLLVVAFSEVESITINGGTLGGLVKIQDLTNKLNALVNTFNSHTHSFEGTVEGTACSGTTNPIIAQASGFSKSDYEDTKVKH